ncbi:MAG: hypothetical protein SAJ12_07075 [Jaaginema sp. PMC 1079.18]|nr:hypothetical protein [Jaaginema sp. PMC 1080.18]MEC4850758.1 hypothetical protein [Jaaginema sp. PMC 1079.18]MEC4865338.1 hypothetical protein [Jaaginema sp. PMC 1078.18]
MEAQPSFSFFLGIQSQHSLRVREVESSSRTNVWDLPMSRDLIVGSISAIALSGIVMVLWGLNSQKKGSDRLGNLHRVPQMPCGNCRFFKNNPYLKCAVQPAKVLTPQARDCQDYQSYPGQS